MLTDTPMIRQYREIKDKNLDKILLFRVGDFYEMFYEDAKTGARELDITLTSRETGKDNHVPLAGFPYHALNTYLGRLIEKGYKVAICEQVEDPKQAKGLVKREIVRVITPGTVTEPAFLEEKCNNYLVAVYIARGGCGLAAVDITTGEFLLAQAKGKKADKLLIDELFRLSPAEIIVNEESRQAPSFLAAVNRLGDGMPLNAYGDKFFSFKKASEALLTRFAPANLESLGCADQPYAVAAAGAALAYLHDNYLKAPAHLNRPAIYDPDGFMVLDAATRRNLELTRTIRDDRKFGSLLWVLDKTKTAMGGRLLRRWLEQPLLDEHEIVLRQDAVEEMVKDFSLLEDIGLLLTDVYDMERLVGRIHCENANARDLLSLKNTLRLLPEVADRLSGAGLHLTQLAAAIPKLEKLYSHLSRALADDPPLTIREGGLIRQGFDPELDSLVKICKSGREYIAGMEQREKERSGIKSLKVGYNKVFGYYLEITRANAHLVPDDYIRKQTLANAERFITPELKEYEAAILGAEEKIRSAELDLFLSVRSYAAAYTEEIQQAAAILARLDVYQSLARAARENRYTRPEIHNGDEIEILDGRHPVVEQVLRNRLFVPNDTYLDKGKNQFLIITGPNMAGKSTYMRQCALIVLMAQVGSFVPARKARIGLVDRIFTRIGAADDLAGGQSTFMVEMSEVAGILNHATAKSLLLLDEVGRGTSTYDGISIARAVVEYIYTKTKARSLFATHYHELTDLALEYDGINNMSTAVKERGEDIVFLHKIIPGCADHSYGIQVAKLAGLPAKVLERSRDILAVLETPATAGRDIVPAQTAEQLQLFLPDSGVAAVLAEIREADIMTTTPLEALQLLYKLQQQLK